MISQKYAKNTKGLSRVGEIGTCRNSRKTAKFASLVTKYI